MSKIIFREEIQQQIEEKEKKRQNPKRQAKGQNKQKRKVTKNKCLGHGGAAGVPFLFFSGNGKQTGKFSVNSCATTSGEIQRKS